MSRPLLSLLSLLTACAPEPALTANAGAEVVGEPGQTYLLDGTSSAGATYAWSVLDGPGEATLYDAEEPVAYLVPKVEGVYTLGLEVCDRAGRCEAATTRAWVGAAARRSALGGVSFGGPSFGAPGLGKNHAPQAEASASRTLSSAGLIRLDGSASTDPDGDALRYRWTFTARPAGSALTDADIVDNTAALASFRADVSGTYAVRLVVRDGLASDAVILPGLVVKLLEDDDPVDEGAAPQHGAVVGAKARQSASFGGGVFFGGGLGGLGKNHAPQAEASASRTLSSAGLIRLDGRASTDPDGDPLRYRWTFTARPAGSALTDADIVDNTAALASFRADVSGTYAVRLVVRDGLASDAVTLPGLVVKLLEDHDPVDEGAAPRWGALEGADARSVSSGGPSFGAPGLAGN